ncbi:MAG: glycosyltransferase family 39 protein [Actinomycetia bacterium]|nr:glycosyltransferase family 39 protein [Actinomycetes bacterium]
MLSNKSNFLAGYFKDWKNILTFIFLIILVGLGVFLRIRNLGYLSFWGDDGHTVIGTLSILQYGYPKLPSGFVLFHGIFGYYLNVIPVLIFGSTEFAFRITSVAFGVSTVLLAYFAGKEIANKFVGFLAAFLITFSTWYIQFSREARYFAALQFFFLLSLLFFYRGFVKEQKPFRILTIIFFIVTPLIHGIGFTLLLAFLVLLFLYGRNFFKRKILAPFVIIVIFDVLQIINQVFFWKVGRSFYSSGNSLRSLVDAYFRLPDPYYFKILNIMFPRMFVIFLIGAGIFIAFSIFLSVRKSFNCSELFLSEIEMKAGRARFPFNIFMLYLIFTIAITIISFGQMYNQQRYIYFLMPIFVLIFSYVLYLCAIVITKWIFIAVSKPGNGRRNCRHYDDRATKTPENITSTGSHTVRPKIQIYFNVVLTVVFVATAFFTLSGIDIREANAIPNTGHSDNLNTLYSISTTMTYHWDAGATGRYVAEHAGKDDIVITTDIYNTYPYTKKVDYWLWTGNLVSWQPYHQAGDEIRDDTYGVIVIRDIFKFIEVLNKNYDKNIWVIGSSSLVNSDHVDPIFRKIFDSRQSNLVLTGRDNVSRLYLFPAISFKERIAVTDFIPSTSENTLKPDSGGKINMDFAVEKSSSFLISGWGEVEKVTGTWGLDGRSILFIDASNSSFDIARESTINITARPLPHPELIQELSIYINSEQAYTLALDDKDNFKEYTASLKPGLFKQGLNVIEFRYSYSFTPLELGLGSDSRNLAVLFKGIEISN